MPSETQNSSVALPKPREVVLPKILYNLSGAIASLDSGSIVFNAEIIKKDENGEIVKSLESRKAIISAGTNFSRLSFDKNIPKEEKLSIADFKVGNYIEVISDRDISNAFEFKATQIRILQQ